MPVVLAHEHTWSYEGQPLRRLLDRELVARDADRFIAVSREDRRRMTEVEHIDPSRTLFIPNGVLPLKLASGHDARAELQIAPDVPVIGAVGLLRPQKAYHVLLRATRAADRCAGRQLKVLIVGDGPERAALEQLAAALGLQDAVRFLGLRSDVPDILAAFDIAVCCSDFEGSPLSVLEYMDAALPVVATSVGGLPDLIEPGVHGLLVRAGRSGRSGRGAQRAARGPAARRAIWARADAHAAARSSTST